MSLTATAAEVIAHRGYACGVPENSLSSVRNAWAAGADAVEVDVRVADGSVAVLAHDIDQLPGNTRLADLLADQGPDGYLVLDIKETQVDAIQTILTAVGQSRADPRKTVFQSEEIATLQKIRRRLPDARLYYVHRLKRLPPFFRKPSAAGIVEDLEPLRVERVSLKGRRFINNDFLRPFRRAKIDVNIWTINNMNSASNYSDLGVAGIITDEVRLLTGSGSACELT